MNDSKPQLDSAAMPRNRYDSTVTPAFKMSGNASSSTAQSDSEHEDSLPFYTPMTSAKPNVNDLIDVNQYYTTKSGASKKSTQSHSHDSDEESDRCYNAYKTVYKSSSSKSKSKSSTQKSSNIQLDQNGTLDTVESELPPKKLDKLFKVHDTTTNKSTHSSTSSTEISYSQTSSTSTNSLSKSASVLDLTNENGCGNSGLLASAKIKNTLDFVHRLAELQKEAQNGKKSVTHKLGEFSTSSNQAPHVVTPETMPSSVSASSGNGTSVSLGAQRIEPVAAFSQAAYFSAQKHVQVSQPLSQTATTTTNSCQLKSKLPAKQELTIEGFRAAAKARQEAQLAKSVVVSQTGLSSAYVTSLVSESANPLSILHVSGIHNSNINAVGTNSGITASLTSTSSISQRTPVAQSTQETPIASTVKTTPLHSSSSHNVQSPELGITDIYPVPDSTVKFGSQSGRVMPLPYSRIVSTSSANTAAALHSPVAAPRLEQQNVNVMSPASIHTAVSFSKDKPVKIVELAIQTVVRSGLISKTNGLEIIAKWQDNNRFPWMDLEVKFNAILQFVQILCGNQSASIINAIKVKRMEYTKMYQESDKPKTGVECQGVTPGQKGCELNLVDIYAAPGSTFKGSAPPKSTSSAAVLTAVSSQMKTVVNSIRIDTNAVNVAANSTLSRTDVVSCAGTSPHAKQVANMSNVIATSRGTAPPSSRAIGQSMVDDSVTSRGTAPPLTSRVQPLVKVTPAGSAVKTFTMPTTQSTFTKESPMINSTAHNHHEVIDLCSDDDDAVQPVKSTVLANDPVVPTVAVQPKDEEVVTSSAEIPVVKPKRMYNRKPKGSLKDAVVKAEPMTRSASEPVKTKRAYNRKPKANPVIESIKTQNILEADTQSMDLSDNDEEEEEEEVEVPSSNVLKRTKSCNDGVSQKVSKKTSNTRKSPVKQLSVENHQSVLESSNDVKPNRPQTTVCEDADAYCFFCLVDRVIQPDVVLTVHPYVPQKFSGAAICLCPIHVDGWWTFREDVIALNELFAPGEVKENICALCSDCPPTIVECSHADCQRSYCFKCLGKVLTKAETKVVKNEKIDWICMCCNRDTPIVIGTIPMAKPTVKRLNANNGAADSKVLKRAASLPAVKKEPVIKQSIALSKTKKLLSSVKKSTATKVCVESEPEFIGNLIADMVTLKSMLENMLVQPDIAKTSTATNDLKHSSSDVQDNMVNNENFVEVTSTLTETETAQQIRRLAQYLFPLKMSHSLVDTDVDEGDNEDVVRENEMMFAYDSNRIRCAEVEDLIRHIPLTHMHLLSEFTKLALSRNDFAIYLTIVREIRKKCEYSNDTMVAPEVLNSTWLLTLISNTAEYLKQSTIATEQSSDHADTDSDTDNNSYTDILYEMKGKRKAVNVKTERPTKRTKKQHKRENEDVEKVRNPVNEGNVSTVMTIIKEWVVLSRDYPDLWSCLSDIKDVVITIHELVSAALQTVHFSSLDVSSSVERLDDNDFYREQFVTQILSLANVLYNQDLCNKNSITDVHFKSIVTESFMLCSKQCDMGLDVYTALNAVVRYYSVAYSPTQLSRKFSCSLITALLEYFFNELNKKSGRERAVSAEYVNKISLLVQQVKVTMVDSVSGRM